jgi:phosphoribosylformylglycinamidine cyclo-ligase
MWRTFNCGIGYTVIVARDAAATTIAALATLGLSAWTIGQVVAATGAERVRIA